MTKKKIIAIICIVAALVLTGLSVWLISGLSDMEKDSPDDVDKEARQLIYSDDASLFESLTVTNGYGSYTLIKKDGNIVISGRENITLLSASSKSIFETFAEVYAVKTISENGTDGFGFSSPSAVLTLKKTDGSGKTLLVGDEAPNTDGGRYMCFEGENTVYLLDSDRAERYMSKMSRLYSKDVSKYFTSDNMISISILRKNGEEILLRPSNEEEQKDMSFISGYTMEKPFLFGADSDTVTSLCETLASLPQAEIAEDEVTDEKLAEYGISDGTVVTVTAKYDTTSMTLDSGEVNPYYDADNKTGYITETTVYRIGNTRENLIYFTYDDMPIIYSLTKSDMDFINTETYRYCQRLVNIAYLTDLSALTVDTCDGNKYDFKISVAADEDGQKDVSSVVLDYKAVDTENFKSFYQNIVSVSHSNIGTKPENAECALRITYRFTSGKTEVLEFLKLPDDERKAFLQIDGNGHFIVLMTKVDKIKSDLQKLISGKDIQTG